MEPGQGHSVPGALEVVPAAFAAEQTNLSHFHCPGGWGYWVKCFGCPGQCPLDRCSRRH